MITQTGKHMALSPTIGHILDIRSAKGYLKFDTRFSGGLRYGGERGAPMPRRDETRRLWYPDHW